MYFAYLLDMMRPTPDPKMCSESLLKNALYFGFFLYMNVDALGDSLVSARPMMSILFVFIVSMICNCLVYELRPCTLCVTILKVSCASLILFVLIKLFILEDCPFSLKFSLLLLFI